MAQPVNPTESTYITSPSTISLAIIPGTVNTWKEIFGAQHALNVTLAGG